MIQKNSLPLAAEIGNKSSQALKICLLIKILTNNRKDEHKRRPKTSNCQRETRFILLHMQDEISQKGQSRHVGNYGRHDNKMKTSQNGSMT